MFGAVQYLSHTFKPAQSAKADIFSVCLRIPAVQLPALLAMSGTTGAYTEPRTADGTQILSEYTVIWTPKLTIQELLHVKQTNPAVLGLARMGERRGLRVKSEHAQQVHKTVRPDTLYLPQGPRNTFTVGPFPFGVDRTAISKAMRQIGWECRPLQPTAPSPGRGSMWLVQAVEDPDVAIVHTTHGEVVITKNRQDSVSKPMMQVPVGAASTLALCETSKPGAEVDPWLHKDPWGAYKPPHPIQPPEPTASMQQMEARIESAVLAKLPAPQVASMEDDLPDRMVTLESQVQHLLAKQQGLENQFSDFSNQHCQQMSTMQSQLQAQGQQLHGHMENQSQVIQSMFAQQMDQIRGLLAKRPRDDHE